MILSLLRGPVAKLFGCLLLVLPDLLFAQKPVGIDVSHYQLTINWTSVKNAGIAFSWAKATDGKAAGVPMGAYHYCHPESNTPGTEAAHFWSVAGPYIKADGLTLIPMLDVEGSAFSGHVGATSLSDWVNQ